MAALSGLVAGCAVSHPMYDAGIDVGCRDQQSATTVGSPNGEAGHGLTWIRSGERRDKALGSAWCETVGSAVITLVPGYPYSPLSDDTLAVGSWNTRVGGADFFEFLDSEFGLTCGDSGPTGGDTVAPFVLMLQEVYRRSGLLPRVGKSTVIPWTVDPEERPAEELDIVELADRCGLSLVYVPSSRNGPDTGARPSEDKGNAILSTLPLAAPIAIDLPFEAGRRVAVAAEIPISEGRTVRVVSVHLDVLPPLIRTLLTGNQTRARQAGGLIDALDLLDARLPGVAATLVGADLNTWTADETAILLMRRAFAQSPLWDGQNTRGPFPTDHMFFRSSEGGPQLSGYRLTDRAYMSDHKARIARLHR